MSVDFQASALGRNGKSILFELSDAVLRAYRDALAARCVPPPIAEADAWTVWIGSRPDAD